MRVWTGAAQRLLRWLAFWGAPPGSRARPLIALAPAAPGSAPLSTLRPAWGAAAGCDADALFSFGQPKFHDVADRCRFGRGHSLLSPRSSYSGPKREWAEQRPLTGAAVYACINLAQAIMGDEILNNAREGGGCAIVSGQRDLGYALALLGSVAKGWVNDAAVNEMIARERAERGAKT